MKQMTFVKVLSVVTSLLLLCVFVPTPTIADQATYIYDDLGRLSQFIDGQGNVAMSGAALTAVRGGGGW